MMKLRDAENGCPAAFFGTYQNAVEEEEEFWCLQNFLNGRLCCKILPLYETNIPEMLLWRSGQPCVDVMK
jgi:hypothetical protein